MKTSVTASASIPGDWWTGRILTRYESRDTWVALELSDGAVVVLSVEEVSVGKWFEVFPLMVESPVPHFLSNHVFEWTELPMPLQVSRTRSLWREEWLEPVADHGQFLGSGPHFVQNVARLGGAPAGVEAFAVEAGIEIQGSDASLLVICSSDNTPFEINFVTGAREIEEIQQFHTVQ